MEPFLRMRWCVLPKVTQGRHQVMQHRSMGLKQPKSEFVQDCEVAGDFESMCSLGLARTSLKRFFHSSTSALSMGPPALVVVAVVMAFS